MYRTIKGELIRKRRGDRSLREIAAKANGAFSEVSLFGWESGKYKPREMKIPVLLAALGCSYEDISVPLEAAQYECT